LQAYLQAILLRPFLAVKQANNPVEFGWLSTLTLLQSPHRRSWDCIKARAEDECRIEAFFLFRSAKSAVVGRVSIWFGIPWSTNSAPGRLSSSPLHIEIPTNATVKTDSPQK
jgi:hypothetical protein